MWQTLAEKIISHKLGRPVHAGELVVVEPDLVMGHDSLSPAIIDVMKNQFGVERVRYPERIALVLDHVAPASTVGTADGQNRVRAFAQEQGIRLFDVGRGICHQVLVEEGLIRPGMLVFGSDSHSCGYGSVAAFGAGMGTTDIAMMWATGQTWLRVPESIKVNITGRFNPGVSAKDLALALCRKLTLSGATYAALEFHGLDHLPLAGRQTLASMAVEVGAKVGLVLPEGLPAPRFASPSWLAPDPQAVYQREVTLDLDQLQPQVARPHAVDAVTDLDQVAGTDVNTVFLGTCTNGRYEDLRAAANLLEGRRIANNLRMFVTPASSSVLRKATLDGTLATLIDAGAVLTTPGCGMCMGRHQGTLGRGDVCLSTGNRNFRGRMGSPEAQIYLASPEVAAATALAGVITGPEHYEREV